MAFSTQSVAWNCGSQFLHLNKILGIKMFDLEKEIDNWKKSLHKNPSLEDGYIEELESHLRDIIETYTNSGMK